MQRGSDAEIRYVGAKKKDVSPVRAQTFPKCTRAREKNTIKKEIPTEYQSIRN
jgi:hypothetical protein